MSIEKNTFSIFKIAVTMLVFALLSAAAKASDTCDVEENLNVGLDVEHSTQGKPNPWASGHIVNVESAMYKRQKLGDSCYSKGVDVILAVDMNKSEGRSISIACMAYPNKDSVPSDVSSIALEGVGIIKVKMHLYVEELPKILDCVSESRPK